MPELRVNENDWVIYKNGTSHEIGLVKRVDQEDGLVYAWYHTGGTVACTSFDTIVHASMDINNILLYFAVNKVIIKNSYALPSQILRRFELVEKVGYIDPDDLIDIC